MKLFLYEVRKIFSWKLLLLVILLNVLLFKLLIEFDLKYFPNGRPDSDMFTIEQQLISKYGIKIEDNEFLEIQEIYQQKSKEADQYLANDPDAVAAGLEDYYKFNNYDENNKAHITYHDMLFFDRDLDFPWELQSYEWYIKEYQLAEEAILAKMANATPAQKKHYEQALKEGKLPFYSETVMKNFKTYKTSVAIAIFLSVIVFISPIFLRDVQANVVPLQYSSKRGRNVFRVKWLAGLLSSIVMTSVLLTVYMTLYKSNGTASHFELPLYTLGWYHNWYDITFLQYIILSVVIIFAMAVLLGILTMAISSIVANTITLIAIQIVIAFIMVAGGASIIIQNIIDLHFSQLFIPSVLVIFTACILMVNYFVWKRECHKDIV